MRYVFLSVGLIAGILILAYQQPARSGPEPEGQAPAGAGQPAAGATKDRSADEQAIRANIEAFARAYKARDAEGEAPSSHERLMPLAWLVGEWVDDGGSVVVTSKCHWAEGGNFLVHDFTMKVQGREAMTVHQRIGWDPLAKRLRSWVFDS